ncbi:MAG: UV damage repair endonuclease [Herpetosiphon sp.]
MHLGCGPHILGRGNGLSVDGRHGNQLPHLSVSLIQLRAVLESLARRGIMMYRMAADLAPKLTHPDYPQLHGQIEECEQELAELGRWIREQGMRVGFHAPAHCTLGTVHEAVRDAALHEIEALATILERMELGAEAVVEVHVGSMAGGIAAATGRWIAAWEQLPTPVQRRLAIEHDHAGASLHDVLHIHAATGVGVVFDHLHWRLHNPEGMDLRSALEAALRSWPVGVRPKMHFASPRTEMAVRLRPDGTGRRRRWQLSPPRPGHHSDFVHVWEFAGFVEAAVGLPAFDVQIEAKASDVAVERLRDDLRAYVPEVAAMVEQEPRR